MPPKPRKFTVPKLDAVPDTLDFRDRMFEPTLVEVPTEIPLSDYRQHQVPILDQGSEGACTGFGLASVANYLLRRRKVMPERKPVSPAECFTRWPSAMTNGRARTTKARVPAAP